MLLMHVLSCGNNLEGIHLKGGYPEVALVVVCCSGNWYILVLISHISLHSHEGVLTSVAQDLSPGDRKGSNEYCYVLSPGKLGECAHDYRDNLIALCGGMSHADLTIKISSG